MAEVLKSAIGAAYRLDHDLGAPFQGHALVLEAWQSLIQCTSASPPRQRHPKGARIDGQGIVSRRLTGQNGVPLMRKVTCQTPTLFADSETAETSSTDLLALLAAWRIHHVRRHFSVLLLILAVLLIKILNNFIRRTITTAIPESLVTIFIGVGFGAVFKVYGHLYCCTWALTPTVFFMYLLPFCIVDASYNLHNRTFGDCIGAIIVYALLATVLNMILIGCLLVAGETWGLFEKEGLVFGTQVMMLFASVIVAVDPVAVLAIFQEIGVDPNLYFLVLGESLFNDAVTVVLYNIVENFLGIVNVTAHDIGVGVLAFFTINTGAILIGMVIGVLSCLLTRIHTHLEVVFLFVANYCAYLLGDALGWSGLVAMITSGMIQRSYAFNNLNPPAVETCRTVARMLAEICEGMIFLLIGIHVTTGELHWHTSFILYQLLICLVVRAVVVFVLTWGLNRWNINYAHITLTEQFILAYGGLRGAVALSLIYMVDPEKVNRGQRGVHATLVTATLVTILFTVGVMGPTMKPLVRLLRVKLADKQTISLMRELNERIIDEVTSGVEAITGQVGRNRLRAWFQRIDEKYIRKVLQNTPELHNQKIIKVYQDMALVLHQASLDPRRADLIMTDLPTTVKTAYHTQKLADKVEDLRQLRRSAMRRGSRFPLATSYEYQRMIERKRLEVLELTAEDITTKARRYDHANRRPMAIVIPKTVEPKASESNKSKGLSCFKFKFNFGGSKSEKEGKSPRPSV
ncbi:unnamed protein product [Mesocestoides corti]|uniref:Sodium/hydrogen exchanger n=1 Tax=Mesocestoides corti TaxID=53468 RepID=A0A158QUM4_MESCO|nr:unnamed protein product [Mesocestoides corti]